MNTVANSTSPSPRKPRERERVLDQRESLLRASILDTALELGVGSSSTVTNWIFNPVDEVDEDEDVSIFVVSHASGIANLPPRVWCHQA